MVNQVNSLQSTPSPGGGISQFRLTYEISPIMLTGGIAANFPGSMLAVVQLLQAQDFSQGILQPASSLDFNDFVAHFKPMSGGTLIDNQIGEYPFANQAVAANAIMAMPLKISLEMVSPAPTSGGYNQKIAAFTSLQQTLSKHSLSGGLYIVATPSFIYQNCILRTLRDVSTMDSYQVQTRWQWEFELPLVTVQQAQAAQNQLISQATGQTMTTGDPPSWSGIANSASNSSSGIVPPLVPTSKPLGGASVGIGANPVTSPTGTFPSLITT